MFGVIAKAAATNAKKLEKAVQEKVQPQPASTTWESDREKDSYNTEKTNRKESTVWEWMERTAKPKREKKVQPQSEKPVILEKSVKAVDEKFENDTLVQEAMKHEHCIQGHYEENQDLMKTVEDLMILGPNCSVSYERDFVAEGEKAVSFL